MARRLAPLILALALVLSACGKDGGDGGKTTAARTAPKVSGTTAAGCRRAEQPRPREDAKASRPKGRLAAGKTWTVRLETTCGPIEIRLDVDRAPKTTASFASLVRQGFFDGLTFHRVVPEFVIQGGDPLGDGQGSPGYRVVEKPPGSLQYTRGVVAMAKTQVEKPGTSGSQFFIVTGEDAGLPPEYALVGKVVGSFTAVDRIAATATNPQEQPLDPVVIEKATVASR